MYIIQVAHTNLIHNSMEDNPKKGKYDSKGLLKVSWFFKWIIYILLEKPFEIMFQLQF